MARPWYQYALGGAGLAAVDDYNRVTKPDFVGFDTGAFDKEREQASEAAFGSSAQTARGMQAGFENQGLGNVPGLQMAAVNQARTTNLDKLGDIYKGIGSRQDQAMRISGAINEARARAAQEKDEARRARWGQIIKSLVAIGVTIATAGAGAPALLAAGAGAATSAGMDAAIPSPKIRQTGYYNPVRSPESSFGGSFDDENQRYADIGAFTGGGGF